MDIKPSRIEVTGGPPLVATFNKCGREIAAGLLVLACQDNGDEWQPVPPRMVGETIKSYYEDGSRYSWIGFAVTFSKIDFHGLIDDGFAEFVGPEEDGLARPIQFTAKGYEALAASRHVLPLH